MACPTGKLKVESKDPRINYNLLPGEKLMTCPYNLSHAVLPMKFAKHVLNCYRLHCKDQDAKKEKPLFAICQYDRSHHVRKEELAFHESTCKEDYYRKNDDWDDDSSAASSDPLSDAAAGAASASAPEIKAAPLRKPPPVDEESMKAIGAETWESKPNGPKFDPSAQIHRMRMQGYKVLRTHEIVGKTKSEKKDFYAQDKEVLAMYDKVRKTDKLRQENFPNAAKYGSASKSFIANSEELFSASGQLGKSSAAAYGYEEDVPAKDLTNIRQ